MEICWKLRIVFVLFIKKYGQNKHFHSRYQSVFDHCRYLMKCLLVLKSRFFFAIVVVPLFNFENPSKAYLYDLAGYTLLSELCAQTVLFIGGLAIEQTEEVIGYKL